MDDGLEPNTLRTEPETEEQSRARRRSSTSRFARELLPASRGGNKPGAFSVFNELIVNDDPLDGSRSLRKRKSSSEQREMPLKRPRKHSIFTNDPLMSPERILAEKMEALSNADRASVARSAGARSPRPSRTPRRRRSEELEERRPTVVARATGSIVLAFRVKPEKLKSMMQVRRRKERPRTAAADAPPDRDRAPIPPSSNRATPFYTFHERENDELKSKPYGGILSEADAETTTTLPLQADRKKFNEARAQAEEERSQRAALSEAENETKGRVQKLAGPPSKIKCVYFGGHEIETWYAAPYPEEYSRNRVLYLCEFCLKYMSSDYVAWRHKLKCAAKHPPGDEIYRERSISVFEVDGRKNPVYCQNLCLLAKLFLGSKTLYYDVEPFLFYVMTEYDELGCHFVGYFSKEKRPSSLNNVSCILTLPTHQRKGYGNLLISISYLLTRVEGKTGSPEKPLSDMGLVSYRNYWRLVLSYELLNQNGPVSISELSERTGMTADDTIAALEGLRALVRDPVTKTYALRLDRDYFRQCIEQWEAKDYVTLNPDALVWTPYIMGRSNLAHYETAPPLPTVAPREDEEDERQVQPEEGVQQTMRAENLAAKDHARADENAIDDDGEETPKANGIMSEESQLASQLNAHHPDPGFSTPKTSDRLAKHPASSPGKFDARLESSFLQSASSIPPIRFEIFPPIPGTQARIKQKRGGWRGGPRKSTANGTPIPTPATVRSGGRALPQTPDGTPKANGGSTSSSATTRRTRQAGPLVDEAEGPDSDKDAEADDVSLGVDLTGLDGADEKEEDGDGEGDDSSKDAEGDDDVLPDAEDDVDDEAVADGDYGGDDDDEDDDEDDEDAEVSEAASEETAEDD